MILMLIRPVTHPEVTRQPRQLTWEFPTVRYLSLSDPLVHSPLVHEDVLVSYRNATCRWSHTDGDPPYMVVGRRLLCIVVTRLTKGKPLK